MRLVHLHVINTNQNRVITRAEHEENIEPLLGNIGINHTVFAPSFLLT
jgi:hypothetical protein